MFKYSCFTENTPEMREWLELVGYYQLASDWMLENKEKLLCTNHNCGYYDTLTIDESNKKRVTEVYIDCRSNPDLFQAVTAMRDDSDYMQWFEVETPCFEFGKNDCYENRLMLCNEHTVESFSEKIGINIVCWRKATLTELQSHFKK